MPRDRDGSFEPRIVKKRQRRLAGIDELVISLAAKGLTTKHGRDHSIEGLQAAVALQVQVLLVQERNPKSVVMTVTSLPP